MNSRSELRFLAGYIICAIATASSIEAAFALDGVEITQTNAKANILHVANNGTDTSDCGSKSLPCRSITQAIRLARSGDTILVGRGRYGELNGNGVFGDLGEEVPGPDCQFCMIEINKSVTIRSKNGPIETIIDSAGDFRRAVEITADNVRFGVSGGFTITGSGGGGVYVSSTRNVVVARNISTNNVRVESGTLLFGDGFTIARGSQHQLISNVSSGNGNGFQLFGSQLTLRGNVSNSNQVAGFVVAGDGSVLRSNVAYGNQVGFLIEGANHSLIRGAAIGNLVEGIQIFRPLSPPGPPGGATHHSRPST